MSYECCCGRTFLQTNAFSNHQRSCKKSRTRLSSALESAKENWSRLKKARLQPPVPQSPPSTPSLTVSILASPLPNVSDLPQAASLSTSPPSLVPSLAVVANSPIAPHHDSEVLDTSINISTEVIH